MNCENTSSRGVLSAACPIVSLIAIAGGIGGCAFDNSQQQPLNSHAYTPASRSSQNGQASTLQGGGVQNGHGEAIALDPVTTSTSDPVATDVKTSHMQGGMHGQGGMNVAGNAQHNTMQHNSMQHNTMQAAPQPAGAQAPATAVIPRRPGKLDPFWIEVTAESDRAIWAAAEQGVTTSPNDPRTISTGPLTNPSMMPMGEGAEGLTHITFAPEGADFDPCVSRDNAFMVFASTQHRQTADIYLKSINGRTITQLTSDPAHDIMPSISPDGGRIAFSSNRNGNWDLFVMSARGGQAVQLTNDPTQELHPTWSPDGSKLAFCRLGQMSGRWELWVMDAANAQSTEFIGFGMFPQWCPKPATAMGGKDKILYQRSRERGGRAFSLWTVDYKPGDAGSPTEIASSTSAAFINANWDPRGERIVYAAVDNPANAGASATQGTVSELWMVNVDGTGRVNLTTGGKFMNLMPCWGGDNRIYFVSDRSGVPNVWAIGTDKAVQAATGFPASNPLRIEKKTDVANVPAEETPATDR